MRRSTRTITLACATVTAATATLLPVTAAEAAAPAPHYATGAAVNPVRVAARPRYAANDTLPTSVDLRAGAPAVGDQGNVGSCVAWSIGYSLVGYYSRTLSGSGAPYAPLYLYMRTVKGTPGPNTGLYPGDALRNAQNEGVDTQADYWQGTTNVTDWPTAPEITNAGNYRVTGWNTLFSGVQSGTNAQTVIQQSLAAGTPVSITIPVYNDFYRISSMSPYASTAGGVLGYHEVTVYGYDAQGAIIRNSWSPYWGSQGDAKLAWSFVNSKVQAAYTITGVTANDQPVALAPTVTALSVTRAAAGATVTISGTSLSTATAVKFGTENATFTNVTTSSGATALAAVVPAHAALGTVDVTVTNDAGTSAKSAKTRFTYLPSPPALTGLSPASVSTLGGGAVTVTGRNLTGATVKVGTSSASVRSVSATSLTFTAPAHAAGSVDVVVTTAGGTASTRLTYVTPPAPTVTALSTHSVSTRSSTAIAVTGSAFVGTVSATVDGRSVSVSRTSETQLKVTVPAHAAGTVALVVKAAGGSAAAQTLTYVAPPPSVRTLSPSAGSATKGAVITVNGTGFTGTTAVTLGGTPVAFTVMSDSSLRVTVPAGAAGTYTLTVETAAGTSAVGTSTKYTARA
jgi:hypothetical protein